MYNIIEIANTHGGDNDYLNDLIDQFAEYKNNFGIKFQPSKPDRIALESYEFFEVYKEFFFDNDEWKGFITKAGKTKDVWLDLFDTYSVEIFRENNDTVRGIKLQASVLNNLEVVDALKKLGLNGKDLIINISGFSINQIEDFVRDFENQLNPRELLLEIGFQSYPTQLVDSGYSKIKTIKEHFSNRIVFADHIDANDPMAIYFPSMALLQGVDAIEKHVRLPRETKYDHFSSLNPKQYAIFIKIQKACSELGSQPFINQKETEYLINSLMKPVAGENIQQGSLLNPKKNLLFRRSGKDGLDLYQIKEKLKYRSIVSREVNKHQTFTDHDFKTAHVAAIVACRLKSTRLKSKALSRIGDLSSIEYCLRNCLRFPGVQTTVLATSNLSSDEPLKDYTYSPEIHFFTGDPDDVINRYLGVINQLKIDVFIRVTGDNPFVDPEICEILLEKHFVSGADYTTARQTAVGANLEVITSAALKRVAEYFPAANYSEYMSKYFTNNPGHFNINIVDLPEEYIRDYRLTLDYEEDLQLYNEIDARLSAENPDFGIKDVFNLLDSTNLADINSHISQKYETDQQLINTLNQHTTIKS